MSLSIVFPHETRVFVLLTSVLALTVAAAVFTPVSVSNAVDHGSWLVGP
jgi:hypothetical protein